MPKFASMLSSGMESRRHTVQVWSPKPVFSQITSLPVLKKWLGYIDAFVIFPLWAKRQIKKAGPQTLFVFTDQALGPWVPLVKNHFCIVHCHDFLAQRSALGQIDKNPVGWFGRQYQTYQYHGYRQAQNFIAVSEHTRKDLEHFMEFRPIFCEVVYNGFNQRFYPTDPAKARDRLSMLTGLDLKEGFILHIGGNQWNKNRQGVIEIYNAGRRLGGLKLPLLMVGYPPDSELLQTYESSEGKENIHFLSGKTDDFIRMAYCAASVFLFPSLAEGFGWPIAEAMASGCLVITTNLAPMTEVAGEAAFLIPPHPDNPSDVSRWASACAGTVEAVLCLDPKQRQAQILAGLENAKRFDAHHTIDRIEEIYLSVLSQPVRPQVKTKLLQNSI